MKFYIAAYKKSKKENRCLGTDFQRSQLLPVTVTVRVVRPMFLQKITVVDGSTFDSIFCPLFQRHFSDGRLRLQEKLFNAAPRKT